MKSVTKKYNVKKLTNVFLKIIRDIFENFYIFVEERNVKQNLLIIMKI